MSTPADPRLRRLAAALVATVLLWAAPASSQTIHGELIEAGTGAPVPGAFVVLIDAAGEQRDADLTDAEGRFLLSARGAGDYALGLDRIGYFSTRTDPIPLAAGQTIRYRLETVVEPVALDDIDVTVERECRVRPEEGRAVSRAWEEARKALNATAFTQRMGLLRYTVVATERELDPFSGRVREETSRRRTGVTHGSPYVSLPADVLARVGYASFTDEEQTYYGPDATTLLSDAFLDTHCFRLEPPPEDRPEWIGVAFEPAEDHRLPDIRGVLWLDAESSELRRVDYRYTNLPGRLEEEHAGGRIVFDRLDSGEWIVREWGIRMPVVRIPDERMYSHLTMDPNARVPTVIRIEEDGGEVVEVVPARGTGAARTVWADPIEWRAAFAAMERAEAVRRRAEAREARAAEARRQVAERAAAAGIASSLVARPAPEASEGVTVVALDASTGESIEGAQVSLAGGVVQGRTTEGVATGGVTGPDGVLALAEVPPGSHGMRVERLGYRAAEGEVEPGSRVVARLVPAAVAVDPLEVEVETPVEEARRARGATAWRLTEADIPESTTISLARLLDRRFAGVRATTHAETGCPTIEIRGATVGLVILDGQPIRDTCVLDHVLPQDLVSVEVIPGLAGGVTYGRAGAGGVIVIETKHGE